jgi:hypothetical protein
MLCCCSTLGSSSLPADSWINTLIFRPPQFVHYRVPNVLTLTTARGNQICVATIDKPGATVTLLVSHANAEDLNCTYPTLMKLAVLLNVNVVSYDYSGYGGSSGTLIRLVKKLVRFQRSGPSTASICCHRNAKRVQLLCGHRMCV